jgi:hypothetical protein
MKHETIHVLLPERAHHYRGDNDSNIPTKTYILVAYAKHQQQDDKIRQENYTIYG